MVNSLLTAKYIYICIYIYCVVLDNKGPWIKHQSEAKVPNRCIGNIGLRGLAWVSYYSDVILGLRYLKSTACSTACARQQQRKHQSYTLVVLCKRNPSVSGEFPSHTATNVESHTCGKRGQRGSDVELHDSQSHGGSEVLHPRSLHHQRTHEYQAKPSKRPMHSTVGHNQCVGGPDD